ncbi:MAG: hypothetical protein PHD65_00280 [Gallionella sp.]|nr:hypothetical protein [Gallionella sp.]
MPSWLSSTGFIFIPFLLIAVGLTWITIIAVEKSSALAYFFGVYAVLMYVLVWLMWRQLWGSAPLLRFGPDGVSARVLKGQTIAWKDITKISLHTVRHFGISRLILHLVPQQGQQSKRSFFAMTKSEQRFIPLGALRATDCVRVLAVAQAAHDRYASPTNF